MRRGRIGTGRNERLRPADKRRYQQRVAAGQCIRCKGEREDQRYRACADCRLAMRTSSYNTNRAKRSAGLCRCGAIPTVGVVCETCWFKETTRGVTGSTENWTLLKGLLEAQGFRCAYSGKLLTLGQDCTVDHKTPRARGGSNEINNLQWVSRRVNSMKTDFTHEEFIRACAAITKRWQQNQKLTESARKSTVKLVA